MKQAFVPKYERLSDSEADTELVHDDIEYLYRKQLFSDDWNHLRSYVPRSIKLLDNLNTWNESRSSANYGVKKTMAKVLKECDRVFRQRHPEFIEAVNQSGKKEGCLNVVMVAIWVNYKIFREAICLREKGHKVHLLLLTPDTLNDELVESTFVDAFDSIVMPGRSGMYFVAAIRTLKPDLFHIHNSMWSYWFARALIDHARGIPVISSFDDMTSAYASRSAFKYEMSNEDVDLDYVMEAHACVRSSGLAIQYKETVIAELALRHGKLPPSIVFHPYPIPKFLCTSEQRTSDEDGVIRLVWAGNVWQSEVCKEPRLFPSSGLVEAMEEILLQGMGCDVLVDPAKRYDFTLPGWEAYKELERFKHFTIGPGVRVDQVSERICNYDFGLLAFKNTIDDLLVRRRLNWSNCPNKLYTYIEAGIPVIVSGEYGYISEVVEKLGIGLVVFSDEIKTLRQRIEAVDYSELKRNVIAAQSSIGMRVEIERMIKLYQNAVNNKLR